MMTSYDQLIAAPVEPTAARLEERRSLRAEEIRAHLLEAQTVLEQLGARLIGSEQSNEALLLRAINHLATAVEALVAPPSPPSRPSGHVPA